MLYHQVTMNAAAKKQRQKRQGQPQAHDRTSDVDRFQRDHPAVSSTARGVLYLLFFVTICRVMSIFVPNVSKMATFLLTQGHAKELSLLPPQITRWDSDGFRWPELLPVQDRVELNRQYRQFQRLGKKDLSGGLWDAWNAYTITRDHPEVCVMKPVTWVRSLKFPESSRARINHHLEESAHTIRLCRAQGKSMFLLPVSVFADEGPGHVLLAIFNSTSATMDTFDSNGLAEYPSNFEIRRLNGVLTHFGAELGFHMRRTASIPVQLVESMDRQLGFEESGYCNIWIYLFIRLRLLNAHLPPAVFNAKLLDALNQKGSILALEFAAANIRRAGQLINFNSTSKIDGEIRSRALWAPAYPVDTWPTFKQVLGQESARKDAGLLKNSTTMIAQDRVQNASQSTTEEYTNYWTALQDDLVAALAKMKSAGKYRHFNVMDFPTYASLNAEERLKNVKYGGMSRRDTRRRRTKSRSRRMRSRSRRMRSRCRSRSRTGRTRR